MVRLKKMVKVCDLAGFHLHRIWESRAFLFKKRVKGLRPLVKGYAPCQGLRPCRFSPAHDLQEC